MEVAQIQTHVNKLVQTTVCSSKTLRDLFLLLLNIEELHDNNMNSNDQMSYPPA